MRAVLQRVKTASVKVEGDVVGAISRGWLVFVAVTRDDQLKDCDYIVEKTCKLRLFPDDSGKFNLSVEDIQGEILVVSQFTLMADCRKGRRPSFSDSAPQDRAKEIYDHIVRLFKKTPLAIATGQFQANMQIDLTNDGPVTIILDSSKQL